MSREEFSFHEHVRLLGYLALLVEVIPGDGRDWGLEGRVAGADE